MIVWELRLLNYIAYDPVFDLAGIVGFAILFVVALPFAALNVRDRWREFNRPIPHPVLDDEAVDDPEPYHDHDHD